MVWTLDRGARLLPDGSVQFTVWAGLVQRLAAQGASAKIYGGTAGVLGLPTVPDGDSAGQMTFTPYAFALYWRGPEAG